MPPVFDSATSAIALGSAGFSITHVVGSNSNRAVIASVGTSSGGGANLTSSASYNSVALEELVDLVVGDQHISGHMSTAEPASGSHSFTFALAAADDELGAGVADYHDVDQTTRHGTPVSNSGSSATATSGAITSAAGELCFGGCYINGATITPDGGQTERFENQNIGGFTSHNASEEVGAASVTLQWTLTSALWVAWGVSMKPSGAAAAVSGPTPAMAMQQRMG